MQKFDIKTTSAFLRGAEAEHRRRAAALAADFRRDEADHEKIRANVFGIFAAVLDAAVKKYGESDAAAEFFAAKLRGIPASWREALSSARDKGDAAAALVEKLKLESVADIEGRLGK